MKKLLSLFAVLAMPEATLAQVLPQGGSNIYDIVNLITNLLKVAIPILITIAVIYFIVQVIKFIGSSGEMKEDAKNGIVRGIIGIFAIVALWGLITFLAKTLGVGVGGTIQQQYRPNVDITY